MAVVIDTSAIYAIYDGGDENHHDACEGFQRIPGPYFVASAILAEVDYLLCTHLASAAALDFLDALLESRYLLAETKTTGVDIRRAVAILRKYPDLGLGLADATVMATAERLSTRQIMTFDHRHFRAVTNIHNQPFILLPADRAQA